LVWPKKSDLSSPIQANVEIKNQELIVQFSVHSGPLNAKKHLIQGEYPYMFDVVEVFVTTTDSFFPYYEFELSPYNQTFQVEIDDLKKPFRGNVERGLVSSARIVAGGWQGEMHIPLPPQVSIEQVRGNIYGIVGKKPKRSYWSAFLPQQTKPNFHQPQFFRSLAECGEP
jgi:hypothetical protein